MKRDSHGRTVSNRQSSQVEDAIVGIERYDEAISNASADYYERRSKSRMNDRQLNIWIAVGLYLILSGVALVVL